MRPLDSAGAGNDAKGSPMGPHGQSWRMTSFNGALAGVRVHSHQTVKKNYKKFQFNQHLMHE